MTQTSGLAVVYTITAGGRLNMAQTIGLLQAGTCAAALLCQHTRARWKCENCRGSDHALHGPSNVRPCYVNVTYVSCLQSRHVSLKLLCSVHSCAPVYRQVQAQAWPHAQMPERSYRTTQPKCICIFKSYICDVVCPAVLRAGPSRCRQQRVPQAGREAACAAGHASS